MKSTLSILFFLIALIPAIAQDQIKLDSLTIELRNAEEDTMKINILLELSGLYSGRNYSIAADYASQAKDIAKKGKLKKETAKADNILGNIFLSMGNYKLASVHYFNVLKYYEEAQDTMGLLHINTNIGALHDRLKEYDKALEYYFKTLELNNKLSPAEQVKFPIASLHNNIANIYQTKADTTSALRYYLKSLEAARETDNKPVQGIALNNLGKLYINDLKQPEKGLPYLLEGLDVREALGDKSQIAKSLLILSDYYRQQKNYEEARNRLDRALQLSAEFGSIDLQMMGYDLLSKIEEEKGNHKASLEAFRLFKMFNDSIQNQMASSEITRLQLQYDFEKAEKKREDELQRSRNRYLIMIGILSVGLVIAILIVVIIRSKAKQLELKRKNLTQDVEIKNKELTTNVMYLIRKNELINNVAERLLKLNNSINAENQKIIHDIIIDLQKESDNDTWTEFELRFNQVHSEFYEKLRKLYPTLTPTEEKLCAFLRLNMSSKEIAAITQQSLKSVEVARARLRKKLNLTNTSSNLISYLANI